MLTSLWNFSDERDKLVRMLSSIDRSIPVLDVGCGNGRNLDLLNQLGFSHLTGVEKNAQLADSVRARGFDCLSPEQVQLSKRRYGLLLMSHIVEHFEYSELKNFVESYLGLLHKDGILVIVTPLFHACFYNDFDHVKPYLPMGLKMMFGESIEQIQFQSSHVLNLEKIDFFKDQLRIQFHPALYLQSVRGWPIIFNRFLKLLYVMSGGYLGRKIGWMGMYRYMGIREVG